MRLLRKINKERLSKYGGKWMDEFQKLLENAEFKRRYVFYSKQTPKFMLAIEGAIKSYRQRIVALQNTISQNDLEHQRKVDELKVKIEGYASKEGELTRIRAENLVKAYASDELSEKPKLKVPRRAAIFKLLKEKHPKPLSPAQIGRILQMNKNSVYYNIRSLELIEYIKPYEVDASSRKRDGRLTLYIYNKEKESEANKK